MVCVSIFLCVLFIHQLLDICTSSPVPQVTHIILPQVNASTVFSPLVPFRVSQPWSGQVITLPYLLLGNKFIPYPVSNVSRFLSPWLLSGSERRLKYRKHPHPVVTCHGNDGQPFDGFPCGGGVCVPIKWVCDGETDCKGGEDELRCEECSKGELECVMRGARVCLASQYHCDGQRDCQDGSDEDPEFCETNCQFHCKDGRGCIESNLVCNWDRDCLDGSDELDCFGHPSLDDCDSEFEFQCYDSLDEVRWSHCIPKVWLCDGHDDCPRGEDEASDVCDRKPYYNEY